MKIKSHSLGLLLCAIVLLNSDASANEPKLYIGFSSCDLYGTDKDYRKTCPSCSESNCYNVCVSNAGKSGVKKCFYSTFFRDTQLEIMDLTKDFDAGSTERAVEIARTSTTIGQFYSQLKSEFAGAACKDTSSGIRRAEDSLKEAKRRFESVRKIVTCPSEGNQVQKPGFQ